MVEKQKNAGTIPLRQLIDLIVKDYFDYLNTGTVGVELESLIEHHIHKHLESPTEENVQQVMNRVIGKLKPKNDRKK